jgi:uncharacterized LabA/DUF88 family protein
LSSILSYFISFIVDTSAIIEDRGGGFMDRVAIFVDGGGFFHVRNAVRQANRNSRLQVDFGECCKKLCGNRKLIRAYFCNSLPSQDKEPAAYRESIGYMTRLDYIPYVETSRSWLMYPPDGSKPVQKGVDMRVALHMVKLAYNNAYDIAILITGDGDLVEAVKTVKDWGKQVEYVCYPNVMKSKALVKASDITLEINAEWLKDCLVEENLSEEQGVE